MSDLSRKLLTVLAVLAVGTLQVVGVPIGYFCACTGESSAEAECEQVVCHPEEIHADGCATDEGEEEHHGEPDDSDDSEHGHNAVHGTLEMIGAVPPLSLPAMVALALPPAFLGGVTPETLVMTLGREGPGFLQEGSPPTPLLVARTMVMLV